MKCLFTGASAIASNETRFRAAADPSLIENPESEAPFEYEQWNPLTHTRLHKEKDRTPNIFRRIREGDIIVQHPYHSFATSTQVRGRAPEIAFTGVSATYLL